MKWQTLNFCESAFQTSKWLHAKRARLFFTGVVAPTRTFWDQRTLFTVHFLNMRVSRRSYINSNTRFLIAPKRPADAHRQLRKTRIACPASLAVFPAGVDVRILFVPRPSSLRSD
jgi:hypothetical protein